jgi:hypothetical protein
MTLRCSQPSAVLPLGKVAKSYAPNAPKMADLNKAEQGVDFQQRAAPPILGAANQNLIWVPT